MDQEDFITFRKFNNQIEAIELGKLLKENNIEYELEDCTLSFDPSFANNELSKDFRIKLKKRDFLTVDKILQQLALNQINSSEQNYYLFDFTDEELIEIILKRDEWSEYDFSLAKKILNERGKEITPEVVELLHKQRIAELAKPEISQKSWINAGYIMGFLGGILGIFIGWHLLSHKKTLPNGDRVYSYSKSDRKHGNRIVIVSGIFFVLWLAIRIVSSDY